MESLKISSKKFSNETSSESCSIISTSDGHANAMPCLSVLRNCLSKANPKQDKVFSRVYKKIGKQIPPSPRFAFVYKLPIEAGLYSGQARGRVPDGLGMLKQGKGWTYYGQFRSGFPEGLGCLDLKSEGKYIGKFKKGEFHGQGKFFKGENYYIGQWRHNLEHGFGKQVKDGVVYVGEFRKGLKHGRGIFKHKSLQVSGSFDYDSLVFGKSVDLDSGCRYIGEWRNYKSNGKGILKFTKKSGTVFRRLSGLFKDGQFVCGKARIIGCKSEVKVEVK